jgi:hypothetical protein
LAGAVAGCDLAEQIEAGQAGTPLGESMSELVADIKADRITPLSVVGFPAVKAGVSPTHSTAYSSSP